MIAAFEDAANLVQRIRKDRASKAEPLADEPTQDLLDSLNLGPVLVRGHYDHDVKRFGEQYACGDGQAREQMKDVLINLQMTLIITLRSIMMDDVELDFGVLQAASDDCRVNAGVCLGQLSQRLSSAIQAQAYFPNSATGSVVGGGGTLLPPMSPSLGYSSSRSTHSSPAPYRTPRTPEPGLDAFNNMNISSTGMRANHIERKTSTSSGGSQDPYQRPNFGLPLPRPTTDYVGNAMSAQVGGGATALKADEMDRMSIRRRSSQALAGDDNILLMFPQPGGQPILSAQQPNGKQETGQDLSGVNNSLTSSPDVSRTSSAHRRHLSRDRFGPDDFQDEQQQLIRGDGRQYSHSTIYDMYQPQPPTPERHASTSYSQRTQASAPHSTLEHVRYLQENARPPRPQPRSDSLYRLPMKTFQPPDQPRKPVRSNTANSELSASPVDIRHWQSRPPVAAPVPTQTPPIHEYQVSPPIPQGVPPQSPKPNQSNVSKHLSPTNSILNPVNSRTESIHTVNSSLSGPPVSVASGPLTLPTDKNLLGFCKGAFRLQIGLESKAFRVANRPVGYASMIQFWRCEKCSFEGPVYNSAVLADGKKKANWKPVKLFDPKVRTSESGAIRYKWAFLAKCHVVMKGMVPYETALGQSGAFGTFGCIFCAAEGKQRGWLDKVLASGDGASLAGSGASVRSGSTANTAIRKSDAKKGGSVVEANSTPIFGNIGSFLAHLETVHRSEDGWPNAEMQGRMKLVVGRTAPVEEEGWDINFVPL